MNQTEKSSVFRRIGDLAEAPLKISAALTHAVQQRALSPYHYVKPFIQHAAGVGEPPVGPTPHKVIYTRGKMRLLRYEPTHRRHRTPILFVYSLINKHYILDFLPG
ncbi:MAG TPA: hypothetical protein VLS89_14215, partial [Candidatus Nanopelagicales bacterium]|nr:hypothetical protein [Candidatus Nanopelagicales bacterium]